jgi:PIN domain nuclease of toxin-antitoxin system
MDLILDTHSFLWFINGNAELSSNARALIEKAEHRKLISKASLWEIAIKMSLGKLSLPAPFGDFIPNHIEPNGFEVLDIRLPHFAAVSVLPFHHRDPFDRLLIAQAIIEDSPIVSKDEQFDAYAITRLW